MPMRCIDLLNQRFGKLLVVERAENNKYNKAQWRCKCDCGNSLVVESYKLRKGILDNCGCEKQHCNYKDLIGQRFGSLTVVEYVGGKDRKSYNSWLCKCDCGETMVVTASRLKYGTIKSCGCVTKHKKSMHGESRTRLYSIWAGMRYRCSNEHSHIYQYYGGRGISVCTEWENDYKTFSDWAKANGYADNLSIERIDVNGDYCPENCRWASPKEQSNNMRANRVIEWNGEAHTLMEWSRILNISYPTLSSRLAKWDVERAFTESVHSEYYHEHDKGRV